ncbi:AEC family transporter [Pigmentiphaga soli]
MGLLIPYVSILGLLAPPVTVIAIGAAWAKKGLEFPAHFLSLLVTTVATPALIFHILVTTPLSNHVIAVIAAASVLALGLTMAAGAAALKLARLPVRKLLPTVTFPNAGNLGLPVSHMAFGDAGLSTAVAFFAICTFLQHTVGVRTLPATHGMPPAWRSPVLLSALLAVACRLSDFVPPQWILDTTDLVGSMTVPLMLLSLGHALALIPSDGLRAGAKISAMRLAIGLAAGYAASRVALPADVAGALTLQMAMPCAVVSYIYARRYTDVADVSAGAVLVSTLAFLLLAPLLLWLLGSTPG